MILSKYCLYQAVVKILPNGRGWQKNYTMNSIRGNQILFLQDTISKVNHAVLNSQLLDDMFQVVFYDGNNKIDLMAKKAFGTSTLYARPFVLKKWFSLLNSICNGYEISQEHYSRVIQEVENNIEFQKEEKHVVVDKDSIYYEQSLGSDVAQTQQVDPDISSNDENKIDDSVVSMSTTYVTPSPESLLNNKKVINSVIAEAACNMFLEDDNIENSNQEQLTPENEADDILDTLLGNIHNSTSIRSNRSKNPTHEFDSTDELLVGSFPCVFPLGVAYKRCAGSLTYEERNHLLNQFTMILSYSRCLMGYLADVMKRFSVIQGAKLHVAGNKDAIDGVHKFLERDNLQQLLYKAQKDPQGMDAKKLWREIEPFLRMAGGSIMYGALESNRCMTEICKQTKRYGDGSMFLTLSLSDLYNCCSIRATTRTLSNEKFPAKFTANDKKYRKNISEFMEKVLEQSQITGTLEIEGEYIEYNMSELARLAVENPVAYVLETKLMISHILELLVGLPAEHFLVLMKEQLFKKQNTSNIEKREFLVTLSVIVGQLKIMQR